MKLIRLGSHAIAAASGSGTAARRMMDAIDAMDASELGEEPAKIMERAARMVQSAGHEVSGVRWLCADWRDGALHTYAWNGSVEPDSVDVPVLIAGSAGQEVADGFNAMVQYLCHQLAALDERAVLPPDADLYSVVAMVQALCGAEGILESRAFGGAICGSVLDSGGARWQGDLLYFLSNPLLANGVARGSERVLEPGALGAAATGLAVRDGCLFIISSSLGACKVLVPGLAQARAAGWKRRWEMPIQDPETWRSARVLVAMNPVQRAVCIAFGDFSRANTLCTLEADATHGLVASFGPRMAHALADVSSSSAPWHVRYEVV